MKTYQALAISGLMGVLSCNPSVIPHSQEPPTRMMRASVESTQGIYVTGFGPFQGVSINPTQDVVEDLASLGYAAEVLDVDFDLAPAALERIIEQNQPKVIISLGVFREDVPLAVSVKSGDLSLSYDDLDHLENRFEEHGVRYVIEHNAGTYVCNELLYTRLNLTENNPDTRFYFFHVPLDIYSNEDRLKNLMSAIRALEE